MDKDTAEFIVNRAIEEKRKNIVFLQTESGLKVGCRETGVRRDQFSFCLTFQTSTASVYHSLMSRDECEAELLNFEANTTVVEDW